MLNLSVVLEDSARRHPGRDALVIDGERLTYAQLNARANQVANLLVSRGVRPGDTVALSCPNVPAFPIVYYGILKAGGVVVPLNVLFKAREIAYHLTDSGARAYFCFEGTDDLPIGAYGHDGFDAVAGCREMFLITATPDAASPLTGVHTLTDALRDQPDVFETSVRPRRHSGDPVHQRHHREAQGRRTLPRQHGAQRPDGQPALRQRSGPS